MSKYAEVLRAENLEFSYGRGLVLKDLSFSVSRGQYVSLVGPNGSGKSTLLRILCGRTVSSRGKVLYRGRDVHHMMPLERARQFAVVYQKELPKFSFTVWDMVLLGLHPYRTRFAAIDRKTADFVRSVMERTDTERLAGKLVTQLSGGELQRVILARSLVQKPEVLFLDEAMSDLDISVKIQMLKLLRELVREQGLTVIAIHHDLNTAFLYSDGVIALKEGRVAAAGQPQEIMDADFFDRIFNVQVEVYPKRGFFVC